MALLLALVAACGLLLATLGAGAPVTTQPPAGSFSVMTFNTHHGVDGAGQYNLQRIVDVIARVRPNLAGLQEVARNHPRYRCDDQPALLVEGLRRATGVAWSQVYAQASTTADTSCQNLGRGDGPRTEGLLFLSPHEIAAAGETSLVNGRLATAVRTAAFAGIPVVQTHLTPLRRGAGDRAAQVAALLAWAGNLGSPRIVIGDLNANPSAPELRPLLAAYRDAWAEASAGGTAEGVAGGSTKMPSGSRLDYILFEPGGRLRVASVEVVNTADWLGIHASDHHPVVARFTQPTP